MSALEELKKLCGAAMPGPWKVSKGGDFWDVDAYAANGTWLYTVVGGTTEQDARFIAAARLALPALIELVEAYDEYLSAADDCALAKWGDIQGNDISDELSQHLKNAYNRRDKARSALEDVCQ